MMPLLLAHGWPDSFWRYSEVVPLLVDPAAHGADPDDAFDVVVPDMPGYGYSDRAPHDLDLIGVSDLWARLMDRLGYQRFGAAGGDIGASVVRWLALDHPQRIAAVHRTDAVRMDVDPEVLTEEERGWLAQGRALGRGGGRIRSTAVDQAANRRSRPHRLAGRPGRLDRREAPLLERLTAPTGRA